MYLSQVNQASQKLSQRVVQQQFPQSRIRPMLLATCSPYLHDQATTFDPYSVSGEGQPYFLPQ